MRLSGEIQCRSNFVFTCGIRAGLPRCSCHKYLYIPLSHGFESVIEKLYVFDLNFCRNASPFVTIILDTLKNNSLLVGA